MSLRGKAVLACEDWTPVGIRVAPPIGWRQLKSFLGMFVDAALGKQPACLSLATAISNSINDHDT